jgi:lipopolysaccharide export LptBFGC system permease protein LptF
MLAFCFLMMLIFLSVALGNFLNEVLGNTYLGFAVLGLFYFILVILLAANISKGFLHKKVRNTIKKSFVKKKP